MRQQITMGGACPSCIGLHAPAGQPTGSLTRVHSIPTNPTGALYAPFASKDMVKIGAGFNMARLVAGKPLYPLIARNDEECRELEKCRKHKIKRITKSNHSLDQQIRRDLDEDDLTIEEYRIKFGAADFDALMEKRKFQGRTVNALNSLEIISNEDHQRLARLRPGIDKLYLIGHGEIGDNRLGADPEFCRVVTAGEVANQLAAGGLNEMFNDVRVVSCHSADGRRPLPFKPKALWRATQTHIINHGLLGCFGYDMNTAEPFAQTLCNELKKTGFKQPVVTGYHGIRLAFSQTHHSCLVSGMRNKQVRASEARKRFTPTV